MQNTPSTKIVFFGTPKFAQNILQKLLEENFNIVGIITAPDKPMGRKQILTSSEVKILAKEKGLKILSPEKLNDNFVNKLKKLNANLFITAAYGKIIPQKILDMPHWGCINIHPSLLPKYRGASPIQTALLNGEKGTGTSIMIMDADMDHGAIVKSKKLKIKNDDTYIELSKKLAELSADLLVDVLPKYISGKIKPVEQNHNDATFCKILKKEDGKINWNKPAEKIYNMWRAFIVWPGIFTEKYKFIEISLSDLKNDKLKTGTFFTKNKKLYVVCGKNSVLEIKKIQPQGKKVMDANGFINGYLK